MPWEVDVKHVAIVALGSLLLSLVGCSDEEGGAPAQDIGVAMPEAGLTDKGSATPGDLGTAADQSSADLAAADTAVLSDTSEPDIGPEDSQGTDLGLPDTSLVDVSVPEDSSPVEDAASVEPTVRFVAFGDSGKGNDGQKEVAKAVVAKCKKDGCDFIMLLGDNIYNSGVESVDDPQWQEKFEIPYADLDVLFRPALGNHDNGGLTLGVGGPPIDLLGEDGGTGMEFWRGDIQVDYSAVSPKWDMPARFYDYTMGSAHFFALDSNSMMFDQHGEQAVQMVDKITKSTATWKIAYGHHNYISNGKHGNAGNYDLPDWLNWVPGILGDLGEIISGTGVKSGIETIVCPTGIDLYIAGHDHNRQWFATGQEGCDGPEFVVSGAGASSTEFESDQSNLFGDDTKLGFVWISIQGSKLHAEFIDTDGNVDFVRDLEK
jgi:tartrate-resistant acid phosphatase type 5